jgi:hypothetical protein
MLNSRAHVEIEDRDLVSIGGRVDRLNRPTSRRFHAEENFGNAIDGNGGLPDMDDCANLGVREQRRDVERVGTEDDHGDGRLRGGGGSRDQSHLRGRDLEGRGVVALCSRSRRIITPSEHHKTLQQI